MIQSAEASALLARVVRVQRAWERGGWLLRRSPGSSQRRSNSALPLVSDPDLSVLDDAQFDLVQVEPADARSALDAQLAALGWEVHVPCLVLAATGADLASRLPVGTTVGRSGAELLVPGGSTSVFPLPGGHLAVFALEVDPERRRQGLATALMAAAGALAPHGSVVLQVEASNLAARALYERLGFSVLHGYHYRRRPSGMS